MPSPFSLKMKEVFNKIKKNDYIRTFLTFYQAAESDVTGISVAYYLLIGIFPILLILANLLPYLKLDATDILLVLKNAVPDALYQTVSKLVLDMIERPSNGLLSVSILSALWTISRTMTMMQKAFDKAYGVEEGRGYIWGRVLGLLMGLALQIILALTSFLMFFGSSLVRILHRYWDFNEKIYQNLLNQTQLGVYVAIFLTMFLLYYILPNVKIPRLRYVLPGTFFVILVFKTLTNALDLYLGAYLARMSNFRIAGSVMIFGILVWFIFVAKVMIWGAVLNASYQRIFAGPFELKTPPIKKILEKDERVIIRKFRKNT